MLNKELNTNPLRKTKGLSIPAIDSSNLKFRSKERILNLSSTIDVSKKLKTKQKLKLKKSNINQEQDSLFDNEMLSSQMTSINQKIS